MKFYDPFCGGCNVSLAAKELGFDVEASDFFIKLYPWVELRDYRTIEFEDGAIAWLSAPCCDYSNANLSAKSEDPLLFENPTIANLSTILIENVPGYATRDNITRLRNLAMSMGAQFRYAIYKLWQYGSIQRRRRFFAIITRDSDVLHRLNSKSLPKVDNSDFLNEFWTIASVLGVDRVNYEVPEGKYRMHAGWGAYRYRPVGGLLPTLTRSNLARPWAIHTRDFSLPTHEMWRVDGYPLQPSQLVSFRTLSESVAGDGVPFRFCQHLLKALFVD
jgi:site-specific DNA-cytosine methylase